MPTDLPATLPAAAEAVARVLAERGPLDLDELLAALGEAGIDLGVSPERTLDDLLGSDALPSVLPLLDDRYALLPALLDGRVLTHRLTAVEIEHDLLTVHPDLQAFSMLTETEPYRRLVDGAAVVDVLPDFDAELLGERGIPSEAVPGEGALLLPQGYLAALGLQAGDLVGVRVTVGGFAIEPVASDRLGDSAALGDRLHAVLDARPDHGDPQMLDVVAWTACADDAELWQHPMPPLAEVLHDLGLRLDGDWLAPAGFDFGAWRVGRRIRHVMEIHRIDEDPALAVLALSRLYERTFDIVETLREAHARGGTDFETQLAAVLGGDHVVPDGEAPGDPAPETDDAAENEDGSASGDRGLVQATLAFLDDPDIAEAVLAETLGIEREGAAALGVFAETLEAQAPPGARAGLRWLRAKAHERLGDVVAAEAVLVKALELDPEWAPALFDLARYASDRGDAERGLSLLRRAGARRDDNLFELLEHFRPRARAEMGRNDRCWCGSGRKYKQCHLGREQLPLEERAAWLYQKAGTYLQDGPWRLELIEVARARARHWEEPASLLAALDDPIVGDAALFEGGAFAAFLEERGALLPDDERALGEQWLLIERSLYEVESVNPGAGITVRDLRTGDRHEVRERTASRQLRPLDLVCCRVVPVGATTQIFGGVEPVSMNQREALMALLDANADPVELVEFLSGRFAPPVLQNTEGEPLVFCSASLRVPDPDELAGQLDEAYDRTDDDPASGGERTWIEYVTTHGAERIRATLRLLADELRVETNSERRFDRVLEALRMLEPELRMLNEERTPVTDVREAMARSARLRPSEGITGDLDPDDPAIRAALDELARGHEIAWLDESIPALAGLTPREAAADPTRRDDLVRLLDSFERYPKGPGTMDPHRLRAALDL